MRIPLFPSMRSPLSHRPVYWWTSVDRRLAQLPEEFKEALGPKYDAYTSMLKKRYNTSEVRGLFALGELCFVAPLLTGEATLPHFVQGLGLIIMHTVHHEVMDRYASHLCERMRSLETLFYKNKTAP